MQKTGKCLGALLLALIMALSTAPMSALATQTDDGATAVAAVSGLSAVELEDLTSGMLSAVIASSAGDETLIDGKAAAGDVIKVTATGLRPGMTLGGLTVTKANEENTAVTATQVDNGVWQFIMPEYDVSVTGELKSAFVAILPESAPEVGEDYTVMLFPEAGSDTPTVSCQWYRVTDGEADVAVGTDSVTYRPVAQDAGKALKVVVTGSDAYGGLYTLTSPVVTSVEVAITGFGAYRSNITMIRNGSEGDHNSDHTTVGGEATDLTLTLAPALGAGQSYEPYTMEWNSGNVDVAAVAAKEGNPLQATLTAVGTGTTTITATLTRTAAVEGDGKTLTATCTVTVKTMPKSIAVKNGNTAVTEATPLILYTNANVSGKPNRADLTLDVTPAETTEKGFTWLPTDEATDLISVNRMETDNTQCAIAVTGISGTNVGEKVIEVKFIADETVKTAFKVVVRRFLENNVSITGDAKVGSTLQADVSRLVMTTEGKNTLTYQWKRGDISIDGVTSPEYTLTADDFGQTISVAVTASEATYYEGVKTASTSGAVAAKDGPAAPTGLTGTDCTTDDNNNGTIKGLIPNTAYEIQKASAAEGTWEAAISKTADENGVITGLTNGNYQVRIPADDINKVAAGAWSGTISILENGANARAITIAGGVEHGAVSTARSKANANDTVAITVEPAEGYQLKSLTVTKDGVSGDEANVAVNMEDYTFIMPDNAVTITAEFQLRKVTITHNLTGVTCSLEHTTEHTHEVDWGSVHSITLTPDTGYDLPATVTVTPDVGYTYRDGEITFSQGVTENITITASGVKLRTPLTGAVISSAATVGGQLSVTVAPAGADANYTWQVCDTADGVFTDIPGATGQTYTLTAAEADRYVRAVLTGAGDYQGTVNSNAVGPVAGKDPTGVSLDKSDETIYVGGESLTLTAAVIPNDPGTDTTVTWELYQASVDAPDTSGCVILTDNHDGTVTVTAVTPGTVRVRARTVNGYTASCTVHVERGVSDPITARAEYVTAEYDGRTHSITVVVTQPTANYTVTYAAAADGPYSAVNPAFTAVGEYTVFYRVEADGYEPFSGSAKITITEAPQPAVDTAALESSMIAANAAKEGVKIIDGKTESGVDKGVKFVTAAEMKALTDAIAAAEAAKNAADQTQAGVDAAKDALDTAAAVFRAAVKTGTKTASGSGRPSGGSDSTTTTTETKDDGTKVTTVTDNRTGTVTETAEKPDGTVEVVETAKDGAVTETVTTPDGAQTQKVTTPEKDVTITVTGAEGEELAKIALPAEIPALETRFEDVPEGHWADEAIHHAAALSLIGGVDDSTFDMTSSMTRGTLASVLHHLSQGKTDYETAFQDVAPGKDYAEGVAWAAKVSVVTGCTADTFAPDDIITREQLAVMLARYAKLIGMDTTADPNALGRFTDGKNADDWAVDGMAWCVEHGILRGRGNHILAPTANLSRAEAAVMLDRFLALLR